MTTTTDTTTPQSVWLVEGINDDYPWFEAFATEELADKHAREIVKRLWKLKYGKMPDDIFDAVYEIDPDIDLRIAEVTIHSSLLPNERYK